MLRIVEEVIILGINEKTGLFEPLPSRALDFAIAGAILLQLMYAKRLKHDNNILILENPEGTGEPTEDFVLDLLMQNNLSDTLENKLQLIASHASNIQEMILNNFVELGILDREKESFLGISYRTLYFLNKREIKYNIIKRLKSILFEGKKAISRDVGLLGIVAATKLYRNAFSDEEIELIRPTLTVIREKGPDPIAKEIWRAINEIQDALDNVITSVI